MAGRLDGKVAVVTGGCSGIGLATVRAVRGGGRAGRHRRHRRRAGSRARGQLGGEDVATYVHVDVTCTDEVDALFATAKDRYGSVDIAFNNAGISPPDDDSILDTELEAWRRVQEVNLTSVYLCCKAALPYMLEQKSGSIINTASFVAVMGAATSQISYSASKGGVLSMSRELGVQFAREGVRVNALCPGPVNTPLLKELFAKDAERAARRLVHVPMGRFARAGGDGQRGAVPGLRRVELHHREHVPGRRRHLRRLRHAAVSARSPLIGITTYREEAAWGVWRQRADVLQVEYADAVVRAGGVPVLLPPASADLDAARAVVGPDRRPGRRRRGRRRAGPLPRASRTTGPRPGARTGTPGSSPCSPPPRRSGCPPSGVCRGHAADGGGRGRRPRPAHARRGRPRAAQPGRRRLRRLPVRTEPDSLIARILGDRSSRRTATTTSPCATHPGYVASAWAEDGTVEAMEQAADRFCLGVQWHPEMAA